MNPHYSFFVTKGLVVYFLLFVSSLARIYLCVTNGKFKRKTTISFSIVLVGLSRNLLSNGILRKMEKRHKNVASQQAREVLSELRH